MGHECLILLKIFTLLYLSKEVRKHKDTNDFRDAYCGERVQSSKLIARFTAHIDFTICVVSAITLVITVIFSIRVCPMLCSLVATRCGVLVVSAPLKHSMHAVLASIINRNARAMRVCVFGMPGAVVVVCSLFRCSPGVGACVSVAAATVCVFLDGLHSLH